MQLNFGFVSICLSEKDCSPAGSVTYKSVASLEHEAQRQRILQVARRNMTNTLRIMRFIGVNHIPLYRLSANLIPLATHPDIPPWPWWEDEQLQATGRQIGAAVREGGYRLSSHLPEFCGFTSRSLARWSRDYLAYHENLFQLLHLDAGAKIIMHLGGTGGNKDRALAQSGDRLAQLSPWARERIVLENDDRSFTIADVVPLAEAVGLPVVFDWHHHWCNGREDMSDTELRGWLERAFALWTDRPPKVHLSSPRDGASLRAHADFVDPAFVRPFLSLLAEMNLPAVDVMVEAKQKDLALFKLREELDLP